MSPSLQTHALPDPDPAPAHAVAQLRFRLGSGVWLVFVAPLFFSSFLAW